MRSIHRKIVLVAVLVALFVVTGCGKGGDDDPKEPSNKWDKMKWDKGEWGVVETRSYRILIS